MRVLWNERRRGGPALGLTLIGLLAGCSATEVPPITAIEGASFLALRCVGAGDDGVVGLPIDGCGCSAVETAEDGTRALRKMGRVECACAELRQTANGAVLSSVSTVQVDPELCEPVLGASGCQTGWDCPPTRDEEGAWIPVYDPPSAGPTTPGAAGCPAVPARPSAITCEPAGFGQLRGYVGSPDTGAVSVVDLTSGDPSDRGEEPKRVLDVDSSIPGITALFVDDLITDVEAHPFGDFIFTVNSSTGSLSVLRDDASVRDARQVELAFGPLLEAVTWPSAVAPLPDLAQVPMAYVSAPQAGVVIPVALDALGDPENREFVGQPIPLVDPDGAPATPGRLGISPDGSTLYVAHARRPLVAVYDLTAQPAALRGTIDLAPVRPCADAYLVGVLDPDDDPTCADGVDNNGNGLIDAADPGCAMADGSEARVPGCPQASQCADTTDNDGDGLIDADDPDCQVANAGCDDAACRATFLQHEGPLPACSDGAPGEDGDALDDRADPDCRNEMDETEAGAVEVSPCVLDPQAPGCTVPTCDDGRDNDGDGDIDLADADCAAVCDAAPCVAAEGPGLPVATGDEAGVCHNGVDDDDDGLVDAEDPGCGDFNAVNRYGFERPTRCADGLDNDGDGLVDFEGGDPDCYAASDDNESPLGETVGVRAIRVVDVPTADGLRHFVYLLDPNGGLLVVDADDPALVPYRLSLPSATQTFAVRQIDDEVSLLAIGADTSLRTIEITAPRELRTPEGLPVFARLAASDDADAEPVIERIYAVHEGVAVDVVTCPLDAPLTDEAGAPVPCHEGTSPWAGVETLSTAGPWVEVEMAPGLALRLAVEGDLPADYVPVPVRSEDSSLDRGRLDYVLAEPLDRRRLWHRQGNVFTTAQARTNQVESAARLQIGGATVSVSLDRHAVFCRLDVDSGCVPVGFSVDEGGATPDQVTASSRIREESTSDAIVRAPDAVAGWQGVQVLEDDPARITAGTYSLTYEGVVPGTTSRRGQFGGVNPEGDAWVLLDYDADFCRRGVEPGDVVLVDRFRAVTTELGESDACRPFNPVSSQDATRAREPLRYVVESVGQRKLVLRPDTRTEYCTTDADGVTACQLPRNDRASQPTLAEPPPVPSFACAAQFITYSVRVGHDQWLLSGDRSGYRHPWIAQGGQCVRDEGRVAAGRVGRVHLGERFENEWFRFELGTWRGVGGVPESALAHQLDAVFQFQVTVGEAVRGRTDVAVAPQEMRWSPLDDRLYVVDAGLQTVIEVAGFDVYREAMRVVRQLQ